MAHHPGTNMMVKTWDTSPFFWVDQVFTVDQQKMLQSGIQDAGLRIMKRYRIQHYSKRVTTLTQINTDCRESEYKFRL